MSAAAEREDWSYWLQVVPLAVFTPIALQFGVMVGANPITVTLIGIVIFSA